MSTDREQQAHSDDAPHRLCIDIDNVIARTDEVMRRVIYDFSSGRVNLDYAHIVEFDYHKCIDGNGCFITKDEWESIHNLFSEPRYLWMVQPIEGVQNHLRRLSETFDIHLATSRLPKARRTTVEWLENHSFPPYDLHFLKHGEKHVSLGKFVAAADFKLSTMTFLVTPPNASKACWWQAKKCSMVCETVNSTYIMRL